MINKKLMRKWIAVLRSRKYKQGIRALRSDEETTGHVDRYCCLGVLCDIVNPKGWTRSMSSVNYIHVGSDTTRKTGSEFLLPVSILLKIGDIDESNLARMNDDGEKFYEIANYLEKTYLKEKK